MASPIFCPTPKDDFYRNPNEDDVAWRLDDHPDWFNSTSLITVCKDGSLLFFAAMLANLKPMYTHQPGVHVKYVPIEGKNTHFSQKFDTKSLRLSNNNTSFSIGGFEITRDAAANSYRLVMNDNDSPIKGEVTFTSEGRPGIKFGDDGKVSFNPERTDYEQLYFTIPRAIVKGQIAVNGKPFNIDGWGFASHYRQNMKPHKVALRWQLMKFHSEEVTLNQNLLVTPKQYGMARVSNGMFIFRGKVCAVTMDNDIVYPTSSYDKETGYDAPTSADFTWRGKALDGRPFTARISIVPTRLIDKIDILGHLPWALRIILKTFIARPYHYQWADRATAVITLGDETFNIEGLALHEVTFVNPA